MTPELERLMKQARDYPNTATVDLLCEAVRAKLDEFEGDRAAEEDTRG